jgi:hypothetical protein
MWPVYSLSIFVDVAWASFDKALASRGAYSCRKEGKASEVDGMEEGNRCNVYSCHRHTALVADYGLALHPG